LWNGDREGQERGDAMATEMVTSVRGAKAQTEEREAVALYGEGMVADLERLKVDALFVFGAFKITSTMNGESTGWKLVTFRLLPVANESETLPEDTLRQKVLRYLVNNGDRLAEDLVVAGG